MKVLGVVTLYYPPKNVVENIQSYIDGMDGLVVWDNTPQSVPVQFPEEIKEKIITYRQGDNVGIGKALNYAASIALEKDYTHLLTMDQDSRFLPDMFNSYIRVISKDRDTSHYAYVPLINGTPLAEEGMKEVQGMIISGSVFPIKAIKQVGWFNEEFVIDAIDTEYLLRIHRQKGKVMQVPIASLKHELGHPLCKQFFCWRPVSLNYPPIRTYYIARNFLYLRKNYPEFKRKDLIWTLIWKRPFYILFMEKRKWQKLRAWVTGVFQGIRGDVNHDAYYKRMNQQK
ncbi:glycosyltransferase family 2 protein [Bacteroides sp. 224]|uniref:glycosyltransferase family 2 protein n=1 Tax=Bacteroides sp. 224 TaxID=2302936 RepID=UPI0013D69B3F|nr:glycosyltransferase family 2 protein [Bacteroides sp. 224]NDV63723.1 glycosyltransferase family 2 protein [Bacteroides sp. 224]